jgi:CBS domain-containing protein
LRLLRHRIGLKLPAASSGQCARYCRSIAARFLASLEMTAYNQKIRKQVRRRLWLTDIDPLIGRLDIDALTEANMKTAEDVLQEKNSRMVTIDSDRPLAEALRLMVGHKIGAILVSENDRIVGIWTERDLMRNMVMPGFNPETARIGDYMTRPLKTAAFDTSLLKLTEMFLGLYIRHIVIEKQGRYIGMLSIGDVLRASLLEKDRQIKELNTMASWEYYENWGWDRKKR